MDRRGVRSTMTVWSALRHIFAYARPHRGRVALILLSLAVDVGCGTLIALSLKFLIDFAIEPHDGAALALILAGMAVACLAMAAAQIGRDHLYTWLGARILNDLRKEMLAHLQTLSLDFFARTQLGDVMARFSTDLAAVENALALGIPAMLLAILNVAIGTLTLFALEWRLAACVLVGVPLCLLGPRVFGRRAVGLGYQLRGEQAALAGAIQEHLAAQPVVRAFGLRASMRRALEARADGVALLARRFAFLGAMTERSPNIAMLLFGTLVISGGGVMAFTGALSVGSLVSFNVLLVSVSAYVESLTAVASTLLQAAGGMQRIRDILDERPSLSEATGAEGLRLLASGIAFDRVSFGYTPGHPVLREVSLEIPRGAKVALVGPSGSGKSTNVGLLLRFWDPDAGRVLFDGVDLRRAALATLYGQVGVVFQESFLFDLSIAENIRLGRPDASDAEVAAAAREAELAGVVAALPEGLGTRVGERGQRLSGGQRQRVAIARALVRNPAILILDEATSALDPVSAASVTTLIGRLGADRTVIAVTHRLHEIAGFDRIHVFDGGRVAESGTHRELLALGGLYAALWRRQDGVALPASGEAPRVDAGWLREVPLFADLEAAALEEIADGFVSESVPENRTVIVEGDEGRKFFIIAYGKVAVSVRGESGPRRVAILADGDHFGEMSLIDRAPTSATVETLAPSVFLTLEREQFARLVAHHPGLAARLAATAEARRASTSAGP